VENWAESAGKSHRQPCRSHALMSIEKWATLSQQRKQSIRKKRSGREFSKGPDMHVFMHAVIGITYLGCAVTHYHGYVAQAIVGCVYVLVAALELLQALRSAAQGTEGASEDLKEI
jgi:hypothetical protein